MKVFVVGANGQIGRRLTKSLNESNRTSGQGNGEK